MRRYAETFSQCRMALLLPLLIAPLLALAGMALAGKDYEVSATLWVDPEPVAGDAPATASWPDLRRMEPNEREAQTLEEWLSTESFRREVLAEAGLTDAIERGQWPVMSPLERAMANAGVTNIPVLGGLLRLAGIAPVGSTDEAMARGLQTVGRAIRTSTEGTHLLSIEYKGREAEWGARLVEATIVGYEARTRELRAGQAGAAVDFHEQHLAQREERMETAAQRLRELRSGLPARPTVAQQTELERLERILALEQALYEDAWRRLEEVRAQGEVRASGHSLLLAVVDPARVVVDREFTVAEVFLTLVRGILMGAAVGVLSVILLTWMGGGRSGRDVAARAGPPDLVVPADPRQGVARSGAQNQRPHTAH